MLLASHLTHRALVASLLIASALYVACNSTDVDGSVNGFPDAGSCVFSGTGDPSGGACTTGSTCEFTLTSSNICESGSGPCTCPSGSWQCTLTHSKSPVCEDGGTEDASASDASADAAHD